MKVEEFYELLYKELDENTNLFPYYKLNKDAEERQRFRKAYYIERLRYIDKHIDKTNNPAIFDCGCGYGSTALFLAMNDVPVYGATLEFYFEEIDKRKKYWGEHGKSELFTCDYINIFDNPPAPNSFDYIILQDTLHHIEPVKEGLKIFYDLLKPGGKLVLIEINGSCILENLIFFKQRGTKRVVEYYDEKLGKKLLMGDENIRSEKKWSNLFKETGFIKEEDKTQYIRYFMPGKFKKHDVDEVIAREQKIATKYPLLKKYCFFGLNMIFRKPER